MFKKLCKEDKPLKNYNSLKNIPLYQKDPLAPIHPSRILITGKTGCGKTLTAFNLIFDYLPWTKLYINCKDPNENRYIFLKEVLDQVFEKEKGKIGKEFYHFNSSAEDIIGVDQLDRNEINLIIFDDFICDKSAMQKITELFIRGRKKNASILFLSQSFFDTPKTIRLQCNYYIFFKYSDDRELNNIYQNLSMGLERKQFITLFKEATKEPLSFLMLDMETFQPELRLRKNFDRGYVSD